LTKNIKKCVASAKLDQDRIKLIDMWYEIV